MDTTALKIFVEIVRRGSFAAVARDRSLDPSVISRAIQSLEQEIDARLFHRTTRRLSLTEAGRVFFDHIAPVVEEIDRARESVGDKDAPPGGRLRVTTSVSFGERCLVPLLPKFTARYPGVTLDIVLTEALLDLVGERIDVAIRLGALADSSLVSSRLFHTTYKACASPDYFSRHGRIERPEDLAGHECLLFPFWGLTPRWRFRNARGETTEVSVSGRVVVSSGIALEQCALAGMGIVILPEWLVSGSLRHGSLQAVLGEYQATATGSFDAGGWLVYPSREKLPRKVSAFSDFLKREFRPRRQVVAAHHC
jgi:DNA-binding transcriptional LysR family regulator